MGQHRTLARNKSVSTIGNATAITVLAKFSGRRYLFLQNISAQNIWVSLVGTAVASAAGSFLLEPGSSFTMEGDVCLQNAVSVISAAGTNLSITAYEGG